MTAELEQTANAELLAAPVVADAAPVMATDAIIEPESVAEVP